MHDLHILERHATNTNGIDSLSELLMSRVSNILYIYKLKQVIIYNSLTIILNDNTSVILSDNESIDKIKDLDNRKRDVTRLLISTYNGSTIDFTLTELKSLGWFKLMCHSELAIEYYRYIVYDIIYAGELLSLCEKNPNIPDGGMNILAMLVDNRTMLSDDDMINISRIVNMDKIVDDMINRDLLLVRSMMTKFKYNPKEVVINRYSIMVNILEDIRIIRFNEISNSRKGEIDENEDNSGLYLKR